MNKEEFLKEIMKLPKIETDNPICTMNSINVDDLMNAIDRLNKVPTYDELLRENKKQKEVIDKVKKRCEIEINASNHYLQNHSSQQELCHKVAHQRILDILKEVSE